MVNRKTTLHDLLGNLWSRDLDTDDILRYCSQLGFARCVVEPQIKPVFAQWDKKYADYCKEQQAACDVDFPVN